ncbi:hypothetical protein [Kordia sp.]|uniref:hypothetical protein n=1 Tax=Kordia sp. TaxID=1965332 RepID=UPI003B5C7F59
MKRSRRSEYNKKRDRSKKDSKRKFTFSNKDSQQKESPEKKSVQNDPIPEKKEILHSEVVLQKKLFPEQKEKPIDFEVYTKQDQKYQQRTTHQRKKRSFPKITWPFYMVVIFFFIKLILNINRCEQNSSTQNDRYQPAFENRTKTNRSKRNSRKISRVKVSRFIVGKNKRLREVTQLKKDSIIDIVPNVQVRLYKGFHMYNSSVFPSTPILAKYSKFHFFYDVQDVKTDVSMVDQWVSLRKKFINEANDDYFYHERYKTYDFKGLKVREEKFSILVDGIVIYGAATLVEHKNKRYFFHFISKEAIDASPNYMYLRRYLNYYLKIR